MPYPNAVFFFVSGIPRPAGSKDYKGSNRRGRAIIVDSSGDRGKAWRENVAATARASYQGPLFEGPIELQITFWMERPKSHYSSKRKRKPDAPFYHTSRPDRTKLLRAVEDALTGILWKDDAQIVSGETRKRYQMAIGPGVSVSVRGIKHK